MKSQKKSKNHAKARQQKHSSLRRNGALHIPLDFETAVEGLLSVKPKKKDRK